jgi:hypothetical protein
MGKYLLLSIDGSCQTQLGSFWSIITNQSNNTRQNGKVPFVVDRWQLPDSIRQFLIINNQSLIDWLLMIKNCLIESGPPCSSLADWAPAVFFLRTSKSSTSICLYSDRLWPSRQKRIRLRFQAETRDFSILQRPTEPSSHRLHEATSPALERSQPESGLSSLSEAQSKCSSG